MNMYGCLVYIAIKSFILHHCLSFLGGVNMGSFYSILNRVYFDILRTIARNIHFNINWSTMVREFEHNVVPNKKVKTLILIFAEVNTKYNLGRLLACLRYAEELQLTEREWEQLFRYLF